MAEDHRPPRADQVDVLVAVDVGQPGARGRADEARGAADGVERPHRGVDATGGHCPGPREERVGLGGERGRGHRVIVAEGANQPESGLLGAGRPPRDV